MQVMLLFMDMMIPSQRRNITRQNQSNIPEAKQKQFFFTQENAFEVGCGGKKPRNYSHLSKGELLVIPGADPPRR
jgi:hypothetical protein